jgi:hypothetical protein
LTVGEYVRFTSPDTRHRVYLGTGLV